MPNCGPQFILEDNITTYTNFLELQPEKILTIFEKLIQYPEFDPGIFRDYDGINFDIDFEVDNSNKKA